VTCVEKVMTMRVFVAGGSGVLGRRLVPQLLAEGHHVTATTTNAASEWLQLRYPSWRQGFREGLA